MLLCSGSLSVSVTANGVSPNPHQSTIRHQIHLLYSQLPSEAAASGLIGLISDVVLG